VVDNAAAVAAGRWPYAPPAQVVEGAWLDAQQVGRFLDGEKGRVVIVEHADVLRAWM
jgi:predicted NAD/FAD-dependent oxidoreductase